MSEHKRTALVVGAGPAGLMAAERLALSGLAVTICDRMAAPARKFLLAGRGGLNLTHSEPLPQFLTRYNEAADWLAAAIEAFTPHALQQWCEDLGVETFTGSSGRIFPRSLKASPLLRAWLRRLDGLGVTLQTRLALTGIAPGEASFTDAGGESVSLTANVIVLALGGGSWPRLGSDGGWTKLLAEKGVTLAPLRPANCGFETDWSDVMRERFAGQPLKNIAVRAGDHAARGEAMIAGYGLEGGAIYALSSVLRETIAREGAAEIAFDLRPDADEASLAARLAARGKDSLANALRKRAGLTPQAIALLRESARGADPLPQDPAALAARIKNARLRLTRTRPIERAISSAGGVAREAVDAGFMLNALAGVFVCGEMLDWEAPTGGYLLQACFSTGHAAGEAAARWAHTHKG